MRPLGYWLFSLVLIKACSASQPSVVLRGERFSIEIADVKHMEKVIKTISAVEGVVRVERKYNIRHVAG